MGALDWITLGLLAALGAAAAVRWRAWQRPRLFGLIGLLIAVGFGMGAVFALILAGIEAISPAAICFVFLAMIVFELYRWRQRKRA